MANINTYIRKYGNISFDLEPFNEIDNVIFSSLSYLNFGGIVPRNRKYITLQKAGNLFLNQNSYFEVSKYGIAQKTSYTILKLIVNTIRYKDILMYNYQYISDIDKQFGALCLKVKRKFIYVSFEGTDNLLSGWKEDFQMAYKFPVPAQEYAINYLNKNIKIFDRNVIVGGHSKGGNLSLVGSMYCKNYIRHKIIKIYNNDGPGLRKDQIESSYYDKVKNKYVHIIPYYSYVGILLRNENYKVIKSSRKDMLSHDIYSWQVVDNKFKDAQLSRISEKLKNSVIMWLDDHDDLSREKMIMSVFNALEQSGIYDIRDFFNIKNSINVIRNINSIDKQTKDLVINFIQFNLNYLIEKDEKN